MGDIPLLKKYMDLTKKSISDARVDLDVMFAKVEKKHPRLEITDIESRDGNIYITLKNGVSARFSSPDDFPVWIIPPGKTARPKSWHKNMYVRESGLLDWDPHER